MSFPAIAQAERDPALRGMPIVAYHNLLDVLDVHEFRPVKQLWLVSQMRCSEKTVERAMAKLVQAGYLERGPVRPTEVRTYRLVFSRARAA